MCSIHLEIYPAIIVKPISFQNDKRRAELSNNLENKNLTKYEIHDRAEEIAVKALTFIAADPQLLSRFLALSGLNPAQLRDAAGEPGFLCGVLDFFLGFEPNLMAFAEAENINPADVVKARAVLDPSEASGA